MPLRRLLRLLLLALQTLIPSGMAIAQPAAIDPVAIALEHLRDDSAPPRTSQTDDPTIEVRDHVTTLRTGVTAVHIRQRLDGLEIHGADLTVLVGRNGKVLRQTGSRLWPAGSKLPSPSPQLSARDAIARIALHLELESSVPLDVLTRRTGVEQEVHFSRAGLSRDEIRALLRYFPHENGNLRLAWDVVLHPPDGKHWWNFLLDATNGELLAQYDWIEHESYRVFDLPLENPDQGERTLVVNAADSTASPHGWHDIDGAPGGEFTDTRGNNVHAQEDSDADNIAASRPDGGSALSFDFSLDFGLSPNENRDASTTQLFYTSNRAHDIFYAYGFDEASGNFQENNYGRGGNDDDPLLADCQDAEDVNNAQFGTPPDGTSPRMELFFFLMPNALVVNAPQNLAGNLATRPAAFGPAAGIPGVQADLVQALDAADPEGPTTTDGCSAFSNPGAVSGNIALIDRGTCFFVEKLENAQNASAVGVIIANNAGDNVVTMSGAGNDPPITIPSFFVGQSDGEALANALTSGTTVNATLQGTPHRDSAFDTGIVVHEYGHGVTNRLTGGASNANCLRNSQNRAMGEGWSDFFALAFTAKTTDAAIDPRGIGSYMLGQPSSGSGIRTRPYSTNLSVNDLTFSDVSTQPGSHAIGEVWASALWEVYWKLVAAYGFDADLESGSGGNNRALELVIDGLKLQSCDPTFLEARDALLLAESAAGGTNECLLWEAFAKRGMGAAASDGGDPDSLVVSEAFDMPGQCAQYCGDGIVQSGESCEDGNLQPLDGCSAGCRSEVVLSFAGTASGGSINLTLSGVSLQLTTVAGESAETVASHLAGAILANAALSADGISAIAVTADVVTDGTLSAFSIADAGLAPPLPAASPLSTWGIALLTAMTGALVLHGDRKEIQRP